MKQGQTCPQFLHVNHFTTRVYFYNYQSWPFLKCNSSATYTHIICRINHAYIKKATLIYMLTLLLLQYKQFLLPAICNSSTTYITYYGSTMYIGIAMVFVFSPYIGIFSSCFQFRLLMTLQHRPCQNKNCVCNTSLKFTTSSSY